MDLLKFEQIYEGVDATILEVEDCLFSVINDLEEVISDSDNKTTGFNHNDTTFLKNFGRTKDFLQVPQLFSI